MDEFTLAYFETALWSTNDESDESGGEPLDANYSIDDFAPETSEKMIADCADFQKRFGQLIEDDESPEIEKHGRWELAGHDFWLTRNEHGAGFWDGGWPKNGDELSRAAEEYGNFDLYVGDDGLIHGSPLGVRENAAAKEAPERQVADFNTLDDLIEHAAAQLGATHVVVAGPETRIYFPRGGQYPYEEARVWRKAGYWHAEGHGARRGVSHLPPKARPIAPSGRRAAESSGFLVDKFYLVDRVTGGTLGGPFDTRGEANQAKRSESFGHDLYIWQARHSGETPPHAHAAETPQPSAEAGANGEQKILKQARGAGEQYARDTVEGDHFQRWVYDQVYEASRMDPSQVLPLETKDDAKVIAENTLQQLGWDTKRELASFEILKMSGVSDDAKERDIIAAFYEGFDEALDAPELVDWLADEILFMHDQVTGRTAEGAHEAARRPSGKPFAGIDANERAFNPVRNGLVNIILDGVTGVSPDLGHHQTPPERADEILDRARRLLADFESQTNVPRGRAKRWMENKIDELRRKIAEAEAVRSGAQPQRMTPEDYEKLHKHLHRRGTHEARETHPRSRSRKR